MTSSSFTPGLYSPMKEWLGSGEEIVTKYSNFAEQMGKLLRNKRNINKKCSQDLFHVNRMVRCHCYGRMQFTD